MIRVINENGQTPVGFQQMELDVPYAEIDRPGWIFICTGKNLIGFTSKDNGRAVVYRQKDHPETLRGMNFTPLQKAVIEISR